jgi:hypothetical protein
MRKGRKADKPYAVFETWSGDTRYAVLKSYQADDTKRYARWFLATTSPDTFGQAELGDGYTESVRLYTRLTFVDKTVPGLVEHFQDLGHVLLS